MVLDAEFDFREVGLAWVPLENLYVGVTTL
jgi:hypothetical protein